jgi:hypothetical protein
MAGYTSTGVGCAIVPVRINCLPEITLHRLWRADEGPHEQGWSPHRGKNEREM